MRLSLPRWRRPRLRLLPLALIAMGLLAAVKVERVLGGAPANVAQASSPAPAPAAAAPPAPPAAPVVPTPEEVAERALLESLRARRLEIDQRGEAAAQRELLLSAAERRLNERLAELSALQARLAAEVRTRDEREEAGIRQLVRVYEVMRPRDAAAILDDLEMPILLQVLDRMREAKAAPVMAAMRPERARAATAELHRLRSRPAAP